VKVLPQEAHVPVTSPSGLVVNCKGPPQARQGRALGASNPPRSPVRYDSRRGGRRTRGSSSERRTYWKEELHPEQTAVKPPGDDVMVKEAPQRLHGGPSATADSPERSSGPVDSVAGLGAPRPGSTMPSSRVKE
jgi:hypothetical protein